MGYRTPESRDLELRNVWNVRDMGDLPVVAGGRTQRRRIYRSGSLWYADNDDCDALRGLGLASLIDLRTSAELSYEEDWICERLQLPHYRHVAIEVPSADDSSRTGSVIDAASGERYLRLLEYNVPSYVEALRILSDSSALPALFHCAAGKDRTGVLAALLLACLDVEEEAIVEDYFQSDTSIRRTIARYRNHPFYGRSSSAAPDTYTMNRLAMHRFLELMDGTSGILSWVRSNGLAESELRRLRRDMIIGESR